MNFPFKRLREREQVPAKEWNLLCDLVSRLMAEGATTRGDIEAAAEAEPFRARIVGREAYEDGQSPVYSWVASRQDGEGNPSQNPISMSGDANGYPAYEEEGNPLVPIDGTVEVEMRLGPGPYYLFNYKPREVWAKLTGSSGALYAWTEVYHAGGTTFSTMTGGRSGTTSLNAARERNGVTGIANDTIVRLERGHCDGAPRVIVTRQQVGDGEETSEIQEIRILDAAGGTFTLTHEGQTTAAIDYDADATAINDALEALSNITNVGVTGAGTSGDPFVVTFEDDFDEHAFLQPDGGELLSDQEWLFEKEVGITSLNGLTAATQTFAVGTAGTDVNWASSGSTHTLNVPDAGDDHLGFTSAADRGLVNNTLQYFYGEKSFVNIYGSLDFYNDFAPTGTILRFADTASTSSYGQASGQLLMDRTGDPLLVSAYPRSWIDIRSTVAGATSPNEDANGGSGVYIGIQDKADAWAVGNRVFATWSSVEFFSASGVGHGKIMPYACLEDTGSGYVSHTGKTGTSGGGDTVTGGIITALGTNPLTVGQPVGSGTANYVLYVDGSGNLAQSADFQWDDTAKTLTLGTSGYLVTTKSSAPSGIPTNSIAGPFITS